MGAAAYFTGRDSFWSNKDVQNEIQGVSVQRG